MSAAVLTAIFSEFLRGAGVIATQSGRNYLGSMYSLVRRNTRRYGGYIIHIAVVIVVIGLAGSAFNRNVEQEMALNDKILIGPYTLENVGATEDSNANYNTEYARLDVYKDGKKEFQMTPEKRVYLASEQPQTMVAIHSTLPWDLYVVYEGTNPDTQQPIIKAFLNPLVGWIWAGVVLIVIGTVIALVPNQKPATQRGGNSVAS
jgi:cytochrome c-type biogenesis protein CcmF